MVLYIVRASLLRKRWGRLCMATQTRPVRSTTAGSGRATLSDTRKATEEAVYMALRPLAGAADTFVFLVVAPRHDLQTERGATERWAPGAAFAGCSTAGEIAERG